MPNVCANCDEEILGPDNLGSHDNPSKCIRNLRSDLADQKARVLGAQKRLVMVDGLLSVATEALETIVRSSNPDKPWVSSLWSARLQAENALDRIKKPAKPIRHCEGLRCVHPHDGPCDCPCEGCVKAGDEIR